ncbi:DUF3466 family protein [Calothrix sp. PCC 6303]|uniref:DUF3466 family protein n=1 Tax=Calothrix sp. PCC 6303 TaxID=1170562 RepID=UPI0002A0183E|nr:DUF3466 family protein [Calothrix sp. PCC 6303]AFZ01099.1 extracellular repeat protein, HAF family [Calothrix sp. PCC 6303]
MLYAFKTTLTIIASTITFAVLTSVPSNAASLYSITNLGVLGTDADGRDNSQAYGINNNGQVVGSSSTTRFQRPFIWDRQNGLKIIADSQSIESPFGESVATGINDKSQVIGLSVTGRQTIYSFLWDAKNGIQRVEALPTQPTLLYERAYDINNKGEVVGSSDIIGGTRGFLYDSANPQNPVMDLGIFGLNEYNYAFTIPYGINDLSEVVGSSDGKVFLWDRTQGLQDLGLSGTAYDINNSSQVVGVTLINNQGIAFIREKNGNLQTLGVLGSGGNGETLSIAYDINEKGQVIGTSTSALGNRPVLWENNAIADLNNLIPSNSGWNLDTVTAINDQGLIVGTGRIDGKTRAFLLTPKSVPEPAMTSAFILFAAILVIKRCL